jgi:hypothetical protein
VIGTTLAEIRDYIESLACDDGDFRLVCARYGDRPVPAVDLRFETRATARAATEATTQYRRALRRYDPQVPYYDIIACQDVEPADGTEPIETCCGSDRGTREWTLSEPVVNRSPAVDREFVEFCHRVAAAVFETLSKHDFDTVESAIMDAYFAHAEELSDPDGLCVRLLESMAIELADHLDPSEQVTLLSAAASRLGYTPEEATGFSVRSSDGWTVDESLSVLQDVGLFRRATSVSDATAGGERFAELVIEVSGYTLRPHGGRLPLLPLALMVHRCTDGWVPTRMHASDDGWQIAFRPVADSDPVAYSGQIFAPEVY